MGYWAGEARHLVWLLLLAALFHCGYVKCCVEEERLALLQIKAYMLSYLDPEYDDPYDVRPWSANNGERNCCQWDEVG